MPAALACFLAGHRSRRYIIPYSMDWHPLLVSGCRAMDLSIGSMWKQGIKEIDVLA